MKNYKLRSKVYKALGTTTLATTTLSGFAVYGVATDWQQFKTDMNNFVIVQEGSAKLNLAFALPILISMAVFIFVILKKNREFFKDKVSMSLLFATIILYSVYSLIGMVLASLVGAFCGAVIDEFVFTPLSVSAKKKHEYQRDVNAEYEKEKMRIVARKKAEQEELDGSV